MKIKNLTASAKLPPYRLVYYRIIVLKHIGLHRLTVLRSFFDYAHITQTAHRHVKRSRYRGCGKSKHIYIFAKLLKSLLLGNAEPLLLVYYCKSQVTKFNILLNKTVSSHYHINFAAFKL